MAEGSNILLPSADDMVKDPHNSVVALRDAMRRRPGELLAETPDGKTVTVRAVEVMRTPGSAEHSLHVQERDSYTWYKPTAVRMRDPSPEPKTT